MELTGNMIQAGLVRVDPAELKDAWVRLSDKPAQQLKCGVRWLAEQHGDVPGAQEVEADFSYFADEMPKKLANQVALGPQDHARAFNEAIAIAGEQDVPDGAYNLLRDMDVEVPRPNPLGREQASVYGERFGRRFLAGAKACVRNDDYESVEGMHPKMHQEFGQAGFTVGHPPRRYRRDQGHQAFHAVQDFFGQDARSKALVSRVVNPDLFNAFPSAVEVGDGPLCMSPQAAEDAPQQRNYNINTNANGDYIITASQLYRVGGLRNPEDGSLVATKPSESYVRHQVSITIPRSSIPEAATPTVRLSGPIGCFYRFMPEP